MEEYWWIGAEVQTGLDVPLRHEDCDVVRAWQHRKERQQRRADPCKVESRETIPQRIRPHDKIGAPGQPKEVEEERQIKAAVAGGGYDIGV